MEDPLAEAARLQAVARVRARNYVRASRAKPKEASVQAAFYRDGVAVTMRELRGDFLCGTCGDTLAPLSICEGCAAKKHIPLLSKHMSSSRPRRTAVVVRKRRESTKRPEEARRSAILHDPAILVDDDFYRSIEKEGALSADYARFLREGPSDLPTPKHVARTDRRLFRSDARNARPKSVASEEKINENREKCGGALMLRKVALAIGKTDTLGGLSTAADPRVFAPRCSLTAAKLPDIVRFAANRARMKKPLPLIDTSHTSEGGYSHALDGLIADLTAARRDDDDHPGKADTTIDETP